MGLLPSATEIREAQQQEESWYDSGFRDGKAAGYADGYAAATKDAGQAGLGDTILALKDEVSRLKHERNRLGSRVVDLEYQLERRLERIREIEPALGALHAVKDLIQFYDRVAPRVGEFRAIASKAEEEAEAARGQMEEDRDRRRLAEWDRRVRAGESER